MARIALQHRYALFLIAAFKLFKTVLLLAVGVGFLRLLHRDIAEEMYRWADTFQVDPANRLFQSLVDRVYLLNSKQLQEIGIGTFFYAGIFFTEGIGLFLQKRWAEYFTIIVTCSFIPLEVYELVRRVTFPRVAVLLLNIGIVFYLALDLRQQNKSR